MYALILYQRLFHYVVTPTFSCAMLLYSLLCKLGYKYDTSAGAYWVEEPELVTCSPLSEGLHLPLL